MQHDTLTTTPAWTHNTITPATRDDEDPARRLTFYVGCHMPRWLEKSPVPLFVSARTLAKKYERTTGEDFPKARCTWALDSGGFTELTQYGTWGMHPDEYGGMVYRFMDDCGMPKFAAPQDWMCEPWVIKGGTHNGVTFAGTGLSVEAHQEFTIDNYLYLMREFPHAPWIPVLQGWTLADYLRHAAAYEAAGVRLAEEPLVGLGSVCRRESTVEIGAITDTLAGMGMRLHGFGVKAQGLARYGHNLASADSMAWSFGARRRRERLASCTHKAADCRNCLDYAILWREGVLNAVREPKQTGLPLW